MGDQNTKPRRINKVEGAAGQVMQSQGPGVVEQWVDPSELGVDYGLSFIGTVTGVAGAPKFQCSGLIGFGDAFFKDYWAYVVWDAAGGGAQPQGQKLICTGYNSVDADFTVAAFAPNVIAVGDKVLLLHPSIASLINTVQMGKSQIFEKSITLPANTGDVVVATITDQPCQIESVIIHADTVQPAHMTSCGVFGGAAKVITFIAAADALQADLDAIDKQVYWDGKVRLAGTKTIVISLVGTGADNVDLTVIVKYRACVSGGYLV